MTEADEKAMLITCFALMTGMESDCFCPYSGYKYLCALPLADNVLIYHIITITTTTLD